PCPKAVKRSGTWVSSPALPGRSRLVGEQDPLLHPPCSLLPAPLPLLTLISLISPISLQITAIYPWSDRIIRITLAKP
ncbi:MAG TPA: hypothetical protein V6D25_09695, partial [Leptolyngbyaceae cyanobacterium]